MPLFEWTNELSVGIEEFDSHHKRLVQLINKLHDSTTAENNHAVTAEVLAELSNYTYYHFFAEEDAMQRYDYPEYERHREEHLLLTAKTLGFMEELGRGEANLDQEVLDFLKEWLRHHILQTDKSYAPFFRSKGVFACDASGHE